MNAIEKCVLSVYSFVYWLLAFTWMGISMLIVASIDFVAGKKAALTIAPKLFSLCIPLGLNRISVTYHDDFDRNQTSVFCQNHVNFLDAFIATRVIPSFFCGLMHAWQFRIPMYGYFMRLTNGIAVDPKRRDNLSRITQQAKERKAQGYSILAFPEGGRTKDGKVAPFRKGIFLMAQVAELPVVPIAVRGARRINRKGSLLFRPFQHIEVWIGPQKSLAGLNTEQIKEHAESMRQEIAAFASTDKKQPATWSKVAL